MPKSKGHAPSHSSNVMIKVMGPQDANHYGNVHGGVIMRGADEAAAISAIRHCRRNVVTAFMSHMSFETPVHIGDLLVLKSQVNFVGKTSMEVGVRIETENPVKGESRFVGRAYVTMVALGDDGKPTPVPPLILETEQDKIRHKRAKQRREFRQKLAKERKSSLSSRG